MINCIKSVKPVQSDIMSTIRRRYEISDEEWEVIKELLSPERTGKPGRPSGDNRTAINGILWIARTGASWRDLPERYGSWSTLYDKFKRWSDASVFERIFELLSVDPISRICVSTVPT